MFAELYLSLSLLAAGCFLLAGIPRFANVRFGGRRGLAQAFLYSRSPPTGTGDRASTHLFLCWRYLKNQNSDTSRLLGISLPGMLTPHSENGWMTSPKKGESDKGADTFTNLMYAGQGGGFFNTTKAKNSLEITHIPWDSSAYCSRGAVHKKMPFKCKAHIFSTGVQSPHKSEGSSCHSLSLVEGFDFIKNIKEFLAKTVPFHCFIDRKIPWKILKSDFSHLVQTTYRRTVKLFLHFPYLRRKLCT